MQRSFTFAGRKTDGQNLGYAEFIEREFYQGDLSVKATDDFMITAQKALSHPLSLIRMVSNSDVFYRRAWHHIRGNKTGLRVLWFVRRGTVKLVRSHSTYSIQAGEWGMVDSNLPFHANTLTDGGKFEVLYAVLPAHLYLSHLPTANSLDGPLKIDGTDEITSRLLNLLSDLGHEFSASAAEPLVDALLENLANRVRESIDWQPARERNAATHVAQIKALIACNLTDPNLKHEDVAAQCGMSSRYLYYLLKAENTTFARLLWSQRLEKAREWLGSESFRESTVREIALRAGFKGASHFSRSFKAAFGVSPVQYRAEAADGENDVDLPKQLLN